MANISEMKRKKRASKQTRYTVAAILNQDGEQMDIDDMTEEGLIQAKHLLEQLIEEIDMHLEDSEQVIVVK